ncbi:MAG TPA: NADH-ubiquinone oxidoreductase-F iron-sulfur binding region domain-containing protein [Acidobacteriota bacterium]|nr:NADH-ubiquinone oxidoreductase-F iron-sulfur binding region domain-containing protein [Acidobacteriota bacterium]
MKKLQSIDEFADFQKRIQSESRTRGDRLTLVVSAGTCGQASGANDVIRIIKKYILDHGLHEEVALRITGCQGFCEIEPFIAVEPGRQLYPKLRMEDVPRVIEAALNERVCEELIYREPQEQKSYHSQDDIPFFKGQTRTILGDNQKLDPIRILNYVEHGGYGALEMALRKSDPEWIIREVQDAGIRGRGGAGFPTGKKWEFARASGNGNGQKYVVCNADEGDPGAYMDRSLLEGNPHAIIEGMLIAGLAIGATHGYIYVRGEYPLAIKHALIALRQARETGLLGTNILGSGNDFDIEVVRGAGAFVCGEETALIRSIEGFMGEPRQRPPYPIVKGIWGHPTCINNVETLANIPVIIRNGGKEYAKIGVPNNTGTKIFSLVGKIKNTGLVEVPLGIRIAEVVYDIGGGSVGKARIKAVQTGGPSGGCIPASMFDLSVDYDSLVDAGSIMGSGGMIVMDEDTCMVDVAKYFMNFLQDESCGKCFTCRKGTQRMYEILDDITKGKATLDDLDLLEELALVVRDTTMCGLGQSAPNPVLSTLRYFRHEFERHIVDKRCDAFVCKDLVGAPCQSACPLGTEVWRYVAHIQRGEYGDAYRAIREPNPFPSVCARVCNHPCEERCRAGTSGGEPVAVRALKRFVTDQIDPSVFIPARMVVPGADAAPVAVIGAGPAGLAAAHYLSCKGYPVTVFDAEAKPGGMLRSAIPAYRLPREVIDREIESLLDQNVTLKNNTTLGRDITVDGLLDDGFKAVFIALGAHRSRRLDIPGEDSDGIYPAMQFLKAFNLRDEHLAKGNVGIIGGGNSAIDAARVALRQKNVDSVTILYRRTRREMPAFAEEIEAALAEGIKLETLVTPIGIESRDGRLTGLKSIRNSLGEVDASGRRRPVPIPDSEFTVPLDTLVVAISEEPDAEHVAKVGIAVNRNGTLQVDADTLCTKHPGVFAGGDVVSGPNTVVDAIAAGKRAAEVIDRYVRGDELKIPPRVTLPERYVAPTTLEDDQAEDAARVEIPELSVAARKCSFAEVEMRLSLEAATKEACRCLRCDLEFTQPQEESIEQTAIGVKAG